MAKAKDSYVKVEQHYKEDKPYYLIKLFAKNPDEGRLGTYKHFPLRYETGNKMVADTYAYKVGKCLEIPVVL
tara:strand:- start:1470 stop:1685 length:216 start_codon:yes stop_codon:yes gene_type:complete